MAVIILESGMQFGEYKEEQVFQLEKSGQYTKKLRPNGIKCCEFILRRKNKLYFIEAKKSCPKQIIADTPEEKITKYKEYIQDIALKMKHSLALYANILFERYETKGVPELLQERNMSNIDIRLVLVVKNAEKEWLIPFQDVFRKVLKDELRIWKIPDFVVINETTAREKYFVI